MPIYPSYSGPLAYKYYCIRARWSRRGGGCSSTTLLSAVWIRYCRRFVPICLALCCTAAVGRSTPLTSTLLIIWSSGIRLELQLSLTEPANPALQPYPLSHSLKSSGEQNSVQQIMIFPAERNRKKFKEPSSVQLGI